MVRIKLVLKMVFDGKVHYKQGAVMKSLLMRMECGIVIFFFFFTHRALSLEREVDTE